MSTVDNIISKSGGVFYLDETPIGESFTFTFVNSEEVGDKIRICLNYEGGQYYLEISQLCRLQLSTLLTALREAVYEPKQIYFTELQAHIRVVNGPKGPFRTLIFQVANEQLRAEVKNILNQGVGDLIQRFYARAKTRTGPIYF